MKLFLSALIMFLCIIPGMAQVNHSITGIVRDPGNLPMAGATISLLKAGDSSLVSSKTTNDNGRFQFNSLKGETYIFSVTSIGYKKYTSVTLLINDQHSSVVLPAIILQPATHNNLEEVTVTHKRPLIIQDIDKTIVNVDAMIGAAGGSTLEVLEKTPGVTVGNNGEISLNGKGGVLILIDGRATYMSGTDLAAYLKSLPASVLDKLELMDNPPSKYDASGNAIINIRLKRNRTAGLTGSVSGAYSQGFYSRHNESINLSYNKNKFNLFGNFSYSHEMNYTEDRYDRKFYDDNKLLNSSVLLYNTLINSSRADMARIGMDYLASANTTYGIIFGIDGGPRAGHQDYISSSFNPVYQPDSIGKGQTISSDKRKNTALNVNYLHKFNNKGREISADINYLNYHDTGNQSLQTSSYLPDGLLINNDNFLYRLPGDINIYTSKADYTNPLENNAGWETGIKSSLVSNDNDSRYYIVLNNGLTPDDSRSNHFIYHENINAIYFNMHKSWRRVGAQLGMRAENTRITGEQAGNASVSGSSFSKYYTNLFPSAFLNYKLDSTGKNNLSASIARRINRPNYQLFNPFLFFRDNYSYSGGNPGLNPQYQYQFQLKYQHKQNLGLSLQYGSFRDIIFQTTQAVNDIFITRPNNVQSGYMIIVATNLAVSPAKWWNMNYNVSLAHMALNGTAYTEKLNPNTNAVRLNLLNQFTFNKRWSGELSGNYYSKDISGQTINRSRSRISAAIQKKIWKDKGSVRLVWDDIFHLATQRDYSVGIRQATSNHTSESDTQKLGISFTYRFGKETFARKTRHIDNAADAEKGRVD